MSKGVENSRQGVLPSPAGPVSAAATADATAAPTTTPAAPVATAAAAAAGGKGFRFLVGFSPTRSGGVW